MKLINRTGDLSDRFGLEKTVDMIIDAGFDGIDLSFQEGKYENMPQDINFYKELRKRAEDRGVEFFQAHAPAPSSRKDEEESKRLYQNVVSSIERAAAAGAKIIIVHPCQHLDYIDEGVPEMLFEYNMNFYRSLIPYCEEYGIKVAVENMWQQPDVINHSTCSRPSEMIRYADELNSDSITCCLDIGHAILVREKPEDFIKELGSSRLGCLHVHDNNGIDDLHTLPYMGIGRWERIMKALADIDYKGNLTYEAYGFFRGKPDGLAGDYLALMEKTGRHLIELFEAERRA